MSGPFLVNQEPLGDGAQDRDVTRRSKCLIFGCAGFALFGRWHERFSDAAGAQHSQLQKCGEIDNARLAYSGMGAPSVRQLTLEPLKE